ncbi:hypothetical protein SPLC1_S102350 [Arthrospira platensis C1]|uniref:SH3b domain-containing protein n=3 Tax=Limnospira TaxID=2596745 RepID=B5W8X1_LIMMA|nr:conserved hypothetical protein [Limnospira maxima CS-328]EKD10205.1 hypothetical protein SPLC1_S102350 [Arthrospira platensis C1]
MWFQCSLSSGFIEPIVFGDRDQIINVSQNTMSLYGIFKFLVGVFLAILILAGATLAAALYFAARLTELPQRPTFATDQPVVVETASTPTPEPTPEPEPEPEPQLEEGTYRAIVVQPIGLIIRDSPSLDANRVGGVGYQEEVIVLEDSQDRQWQRVRAATDEGRTGWVRGGNTEPIN